MRCRQEQHIDAGIFHPLPGKALERKATIPGDLRIDLAQVLIGTVAVAAEQDRLLRAVVPREQAHKFEAGITCRSEHRGLYLLFQLAFLLPFFELIHLIRSSRTLLVILNAGGLPLAAGVEGPLYCRSSV